MSTVLSFGQHTVGNNCADAILFINVEIMYAVESGKFSASCFPVQCDDAVYFSKKRMCYTREQSDPNPRSVKAVGCPEWSLFFLLQPTQRFQDLVPITLSFVGTSW